jgi:hypothetical protein
MPLFVQLSTCLRVTEMDEILYPLQNRWLQTRANRRWHVKYEVVDHKDNYKPPFYSYHKYYWAARYAAWARYQSATWGALITLTDTHKPKKLDYV